MLPVGWLVAIVLAAVLLTMWITFTATRLDRLHARVDAAQAALDAQLVRRAAALAHVAESAGPGRRPELEALARSALDPAQDGVARRGTENAVGRAVLQVVADADADTDSDTDAAPGSSARPVGEAAVAELREAAARVLLARRFYNDAVRDTRTLRARRMPRLFRLAGRREMPEFFDIDDTPPPRPSVTA